MLSTVFFPSKTYQIFKSLKRANLPYVRMPINILRKTWQISIFNTIFFTLFLTFRSYPSSESSESSETTSSCINLMAGRSELYFNNVGITIIPTTLYCMYYTYVRIVCWSQLDNVPYMIRFRLQHCNPSQQPRFFDCAILRGKGHD